MATMAADRLELMAGLDFSASDDQPVFTINAVSEVLGVHPETIRAWERRGLITTERNNNRRFFSRVDVLRLEFIMDLLENGFNLTSIKEYLRFYPCWYIPDCRLCNNAVINAGPFTKKCWKKSGNSCSIINMPDYNCRECQACQQICD